MGWMQDGLGWGAILPRVWIQLNVGAWWGRENCLVW